MIALETLLGEDTTIGVEELLNRESTPSVASIPPLTSSSTIIASSSNPVTVNGRAMMEKKLNFKH